MFTAFILRFPISLNMLSGIINLTKSIILLFSPQLLPLQHIMHVTIAMLHSNAVGTLQSLP